MSDSHSLNTSTFAPPEHSFSSGFLSRRLSTHPEPPELREVSRGTDEPESVYGSQEAVGRRKRTTAETCTGTG